MAWNEVLPSTIVKCFAMCGVVDRSDEVIDEPDLMDLVEALGIDDPCFEEDIDVCHFSESFTTPSEEHDVSIADSEGEEEVTVVDEKSSSTEACTILKRLRSFVTKVMTTRR